MNIFEHYNEINRDQNNIINLILYLKTLYFSHFHFQKMISKILVKRTFFEHLLLFQLK